MAETPLELDLRGLRCPLPVLHTQKRLKMLRRGDRLRVLADDPLAALDIANLCREDGHRLVESRSLGAATRFEIVAAGEG
ncbi:sulfurtransferase TusA family protein [Jiella sp. CBK1P-4]|uniref:Sulfurtransferase TusA family protein n=2 Tax=Jiella avicenniae TaxID=2907202 RepID=A0A9X1NYA9_9HYPH|nr:sulfurtransferase TusA family protein [Jiella avicenniae]MCE7027975.1 sulfurtransferase TusA family protein [Jiella avicenniae]